MKKEHELEAMNRAAKVNFNKWASWASRSPGRLLRLNYCNKRLLVCCVNRLSTCCGIMPGSTNGYW